MNTADSHNLSAADERLFKLYTRGVAAALGLLGLWLIVSLSFSVGFQVWEETMRSRRVPKAPMIALTTKEVSDDCQQRIEGFWNEFTKHVKLSWGTIKKDPTLGQERWVTWFRDWHKSYSVLGDRYGFTHAVTNPGHFYKADKKRYETVLNAADQYNTHLEALFKLYLEELPSIETQFHPLPPSENISP